MEHVDKDRVSEKMIDSIFNEIHNFTNGEGQIMYEDLIKTMLTEPDPLELPDTIKVRMS